MKAFLVVDVVKFYLQTEIKWQIVFQLEGSATSKELNFDQIFNEEYLTWVTSAVNVESFNRI